MPRPIPAVTRARVIQGVKDRLVRDSFPRLQMGLIVGLTGGFGLLSSFFMLQVGVDAMAVRYPLAVSCAYLFFLFLIWLWLHTNAKDYLDVPDPSAWVSWPKMSEGGSVFKSGGGGDFGGGGVSGTFEGPAADLEESLSTPLNAVSKTVGSVADADEMAIPLAALTFVVTMAVGMALASLYVVYIAPVLFAEVLVDGSLSYVLFRHLRRQDPRHWMSSAFARTLWPFAVTAVFLAAVGAGMSAYAPGAKSVGQVLDHARSHRVAR